ncbi:unnamed protein product [Sympodiomycopsis kandeliae]
MSSHTPPRPSTSRLRSRGQLARRESFTRQTNSSDSEGDDLPTLQNKGSGVGGGGERPVLGGLTVFDILFIAIAYALNLLRTLGVAELGDIVCKGLIYLFTALPFEFYKRWTFSHPKVSPHTNTSSDEDDDDEDDDEEEYQEHEHTDASKRPHPIAPPLAQLSPFHHLVILLTRFACSNFPHLMPRVLFAEETMLPFVGWRTGGASWSLMREISSSTETTPDRKWRAVWMGSDAYTPSATRRTDPVSRRASTILYLHGGGFSLGSVSFYAEALLRVLNKVATFESEMGHTQSNTKARCIAVEYDLSPTARFPQPLLQCLRCYAHLVEVEKIDPQSITFAGDSAGGNLAMSMLLVLTGQGAHQPELRERDWSQLPLPGKAVFISPWVDLRPQKAHAFAPLRHQQRPNDSKTSNKTSEKTSSKAHGINDSIVQYEWDYVASETLLHFAQVYAGVLEKPRRVMGPIGWLSHLCGVLSRGLEAEKDARKKKNGNGGNGNGKSRKSSTRTSAASRTIIDPARRLARAVQSTLEQPVFEQLLASSGSDGEKPRKKRNHQQRKGSPPQSQSKAVASSSTPPSSLTNHVPSFASGLMPLFTPSERDTDKVYSTSDLHAPFEADDDSDASSDDHGQTDKAAQDLSTNPLLSPILGDWTKVQLQRGALVSWGERERLSADIESWVEIVQSGRYQDPKAPTTQDGEHPPPRPDGEEEREREMCLQRGKWLQTAVEHGPGGVHAWPFVAMYLAGTEFEREKGLETLARFISRPKEEAIDRIAARADYQEDTDWGNVVSQDTFVHHSSSSEPGLESPTFFTSHASREAAAGRAFSEEEYKSAFGLGVQSSSQYTPYLDSRAGEVLRGRQVEPSRPLWWSGHEYYQHQPGIATYHDDYERQQQEEEQQQGVTRGCLHAQKKRQNDEGIDDDDAADDPVSPDVDRPQQVSHATQDYQYDDDEEEDEEGSSTPRQDYADDDTSSYLDASNFGLTWSTQKRPWDEGLSDISEEGSVLSASPPPPSESRWVAPSSSSSNEQTSQAPRLELSPETRRFIRLEAQRQLAEEMESGQQEEEELFSPTSDTSEQPEEQSGPADSAGRNRSSSRESKRAPGDAWWAGMS